MLLVGALLFGFMVFASWLSCQLFAGRAAFLLVGAMLATTMSANVFMIIIPGQRKVVASLRAGTPVNPIHGQRGKQRSVHNTYFTLPVVFAMLSNHYGFLYNGAHNWVVLVLMMLAGALIRASFVLRHKALAFGKPTQWGYAVAGVMLTVESQPSERLLRLVAGQLKADPTAWNEYGQRAETRREHVLELQAVFGFRSFTNKELTHDVV